jgi:hypothetical protein
MHPRGQGRKKRGLTWPQRENEGDKASTSVQAYLAAPVQAPLRPASLVGFSAYT